MSEKLTRIRLPGLANGEGYMEWGEQSAETMVAIMRRRAAYLRNVVEKIEAAEDADFQIDVVRGSHVQHHVREIQSSTRQRGTDA